jgi:dTDP-4-amino-4,6-dideoxygalactose transaminase
MSEIALFGGAPVVDRAAHRRWPEVTESERQGVMRVLDRGVLSGANAPETTALEAEFGAFVGAEHCLLTHCGTSALHLALAVSGVRAGDHVVVPAYSFVATALAVVHAGAIPIFADVDPLTGNLDPESANAALTSRTRAIMPVHVHGCPAELGALLALAETHGVSVVEDAAQAHGATYRGRPVGAIGRAGGFSLQSSKNLSAGEGGIFVTNDPALAEEANRLRNFGQDVSLPSAAGFDPARPLDGSRSLDSLRVGWMYRGNEMMAAFARAQLARLPVRTERCQRNADRLRRALVMLPGLTPPSVPAGSSSVHHKFRVLLDPVAAGVSLSPRAFRDVVAEALVAEGLEVVAWQTDVLPGHTVFQRREGFGSGWPWTTDRETDFERAYDAERYPNARRLLEGSLVLFSQSCPLIAQDDAMVERYAEAFARVWTALPALEKRAREAGERA